MSFILDTNVVSELMGMRPNPSVIHWVDGQAHEILHLTSITVAEIRVGLRIMPEGRRQTELRERLDRVLPVFDGRILAFDEAAAERFAEIEFEARRRGKPIAPFDSLIAAIAQVHGFTVVTRDTAPFEAAGVAVVDPWLDDPKST